MFDPDPLVGAGTPLGGVACGVGVSGGVGGGRVGGLPAGTWNGVGVGVAGGAVGGGTNGVGVAIGGLVGTITTVERGVGREVGRGVLVTSWSSPEAPVAPVPCRDTPSGWNTKARRGVEVARGRAVGLGAGPRSSSDEGPVVGADGDDTVVRRSRGGSVASVSGSGLAVGARNTPGGG